MERERGGRHLEGTAETGQGAENLLRARTLERVSGQHSALLRAMAAFDRIDSSRVDVPSPPALGCPRPLPRVQLFKRFLRER